jgi:ankyrin repeat protein
MSVFDSARPYRTLPRSPDLAHLREEAKSLKQACASGDPGACAFVQMHVSQASGPVKLADAQLALARAHGFRSWPRLKAFVEAQARSPQERIALLLSTLFTDNFTLLEELYGRRAGLPRGDFFLAAAVADAAAVEAMLEADPGRAREVGGPLRCQALVYAAHARLFLWDDTFRERQLRIVTALLAHGADPNAFAPKEQGDGGLSALYGCCRAPGNPQVAKLLLDAGARTGDGESVYHASELPDTACLELLFARGVPAADRDFCIRRALDGENPAAVAVYLNSGADPNHLDWALFRDRSLAVIELLLAHGADAERPAEDHWLLERIRGLMPVQVAERAGRDDAVGYLLSRGVADSRTPQDLFIGACARGDGQASRALLREHPQLAVMLSEQDRSNLATLARAGRIESVRLMLDAGFDIEARADDLNATALHYAATNGDVAMVELLLSRGARRDVRHKYGGTPLSASIYCAAHFRTAHGDYAGVVRRLLEAGDVASEDNLRLAVDSDLDDIAEVLKAHGVAL